MKWMPWLILTALVCVLGALLRPVPPAFPPGNPGVRTDQQLGEAERARQQELLNPIMLSASYVDGELRAADMEGEPVEQHSELFGLANSRVTFPDSELYVFELDAAEGLGGFSARVVDGCIVETRLLVPEW